MWSFSASFLVLKYSRARFPVEESLPEMETHQRDFFSSLVGITRHVNKNQLGSGNSHLSDLAILTSK